MCRQAAGAERVHECMCIWIRSVVYKRTANADEGGDFPPALQNAGEFYCRCDWLLIITETIQQSQYTLNWWSAYHCYRHVDFSLSSSDMDGLQQSQTKKKGKTANRSISAILIITINTYSLLNVNLKLSDT